MKRILCYGDSNTFGHNPKDCSRLSENLRWTRLLKKLLGDEYEVIEEGLCGRTTVYDDCFSDGLNGIKLLEPILKTHSPVDLVVLMLGTNDIQLQFASTPHDSARGIEALVKIIKNPMLYGDKNPPEILIVSPILIDPAIANSMFADLYGVERAVEFSKQLAPKYENISKLYKAHFINAAEFAKASVLDGVHMDAENHKKFAENIAEKIKNII